MSSGQKKGITITTANGQLTIWDRVLCRIPCLGISIEAIVLDHTPAALSLGALVEAGFSFNWNVLHPEMWDVEGEPIDLVKLNRVPYIYQSEGLAMAALQVADPDDDQEVSSFSKTLTTDCVSKLVELHRTMKTEINKAGVALPSAMAGPAQVAGTASDGAPAGDAAAVDEGEPEDLEGGRRNVYYGI